MRRQRTAKAHVLATLVWLAAASAASAWPAAARAAGPATFQSPNGQVKVRVEPDNRGRLRFTVMMKDKPVLANCALGIVVADKDLGAGTSLGDAVLKQIDETYPLHGGHAKAVNRGVEAVIPVNVEDGPLWSLEMRAYDDGVAYRYRVPGSGKRRVSAESSEWRLPTGCRVFFQAHNDRKDYENPWQAAATGDLLERLKPRPRAGSTAPVPPAPGIGPDDPPAIIAAPATYELPDGLGFAMVTEANLVDYTDTALRYVGEDTFRAYLHNDPKGFDLDGEIVTSWRVTVLAADLNALVNTDLITNLCPPPPAKLADATWIKPGRSTWHWMVSGRPKFEDQRAWVDWTRQLGFEYYLIDDGWNRWKQGDKDNWACLKEVVEYAKTQNVAIWAWVNSKELGDDRARADYYARAKQAGVVGLKIDFMKPANTEWVRWYEQTISQAADHQLMLNFHGSQKPSGRQRTLPNDMTRESVRGREMGKQPPMHDAILPFTRFVQGPADYTPVDFRPDKLKGSSYAHELSMAILFTSPFFCYGGAPQNYLENEAIDVIKAIPATWDETRVLPGSKIGEIAAFARRKGDDWFVGVMNGAELAGFKIDLGFLGEGSYAIDKLGDVPDRHDAFAREKGTVTAKDALTVDLRRDGGFVARITRATN